MHRISSLSLAFLLIQTPLHAASAAFADDGKTVFAINGDGFDIIHLDTGKIESLKPVGVTSVQGICPAGDGAFYLAAGKALWRWKPGKAPALRIEKAPVGCSFINVACHRETGAVLIVGEVKLDTGNYNPLFYKPDAKQHSVKLKQRHLADAEILGPEFLADGTLMFSAEGDLWHGDFELETIPAEDGEPARQIGSLTAYRFAPLAERYTDSGTSSELGVDDIACGAGRLFVHVGRIGGSGRGHLASLTAPDARKDGEFPTRNEVADSIRTLQSTKTLLDCPSLSFLCASADRKQVYLCSETDSGKTHFLAKSDVEGGKPIPFRIGDMTLIEP